MCLVTAVHSLAGEYIRLNNSKEMVSFVHAAFFFVFFNFPQSSGGPLISLLLWGPLII